MATITVQTSTGDFELSQDFVKQPAQEIPIYIAEMIASSYGYDQIIIYARKVDIGEHMTTYGVDKKHCSAAAKIGNFLKYKIMGWEKENGHRK